MAIDIKVKAPRWPSPTKLPPPGERGRTRITDPGRERPPGLGVYVHERALEGAVQRAAQGGDLEVGGFLLGGYHRWAGRPYVDITAQVPALKAESARAQLTFTNEAQRELHEAQERRYPGTLVLGWYHTHPGYGLFLSAHDQFIHGNFYGGPHHVALVIDLRAARRDQVGIFVWESEGKLSGEPYDLAVYATTRA